MAAQKILFVTNLSSQDTAGIANEMSKAYAEISAFMKTAGIIMTGQPMAITRSREEGGFQFDAAIPVDFIPAELSGNIQAGQSPSGPAIRAVHHGPYDQMTPTYEKLAAYMSAHNIKPGKVSWEHYLSDPAVTQAQDMVTHVYIMLEESYLQD